ncbi:glycosyltransferase family 4 protein [Burkholderia gladioli]|uniref:glycosyltransferase family 4 protein n=1 Tax=Burkholderia gladioli TaxID=28095 RepID=UPI001FC7BC48|nr:glycosyltransferase family 1 protein [Burkholderia gladioli]
MPPDSPSRPVSLSLRIHCRLATRLPGLLLRSARERLRVLAATAATADAADGPSRQLLIDVSIIAAHDAGTGIQRVVRRLAEGLLRHPPHGYTVCLVRATRKLPYRYADDYARTLVGEAASPHDCSDRPLTVRAGDVFVGLDLASRIVPRRMDDLIAMKAAGARVTFVVYDLLPAIHPHWFTRRAARDFRRWLSFLGLHADALFCISATVAGETRDWLSRRFGLAGSQPLIGDFRLGSDFTTLAPRMPKAPGYNGMLTLLMVGTVEPRKGHAAVLEAMDLLWRRGVPIALTIAGRPGWRIDTLAERLRDHPEVGKRLIWLPAIDDVALSRRYDSADGLIMASQAEGFGLPLVEAALHGLPILARDIPVFREVAGEHARYFASGEPAQLADAIECWAAELRAGTAPDSRGMPLATWDDSTAHFTALLQRAAAPAPNMPLD